MDKLNRLKALTEEDEISDTSTQDNWGHQIKPRHLYEGTDSEDEEITTSRRIEIEPYRFNNYISTKSDARPDEPTKDFKEYQLRQGELALDGECFVPWPAIKKYPYTYIGRANSELVARHFFDQYKIYDNIWDFFYLHRAPQDPNKSAIFLVPTKQFESFLGTINQKLGLYLTIPSGPTSNSGFRLTFPHDGNPRPRYLGRATSRKAAEKLQTDILPRYFKLAGEPSVIENPSQASLIEFKAKVDLVTRLQRGKKMVNKEKQKAERVAKQQSWNKSIKRVQRYLGIRQASLASQTEAIRAGLQNSSLQWMDYVAAVQDAVAKLPPSKDLDVARLAPYNQEGSVVFVCVDVEAYERNTRQITEIGIATLDTKNIAKLNPGNGGVNWREMIRARHFRIREYRHLENSEFVNGCADKFEFGDSEFISIKDAPHVVSTCFKHPFSKPNMEPSTNEDLKRNIILVGHDVEADIKFLQSIGYDVHTLSTLRETVDTSLMWRYIKRENNPRNLASILAEVGIISWNLHNAGNDAVYTLQAMIAIALMDMTERQKQKEIKEQEQQSTVTKSVKEETARAGGNEEGWSSAGDETDGGAAIRPTVVAKVAKNVTLDPKKYSDGPSRPTNPKLDRFRQGSNDFWGAAVPNRESAPPVDGFGRLPETHSFSLERQETTTWTSHAEQNTWSSRNSSRTTHNTIVEELTKNTELFTIEDSISTNKAQDTQWPS